MADTGVKFGDCKVLLEISDGVEPAGAAKGFGGLMNHLMQRAGIPNMQDVFAASRALMNSWDKGVCGRRKDFMRKGDFDGGFIDG